MRNQGRITMIASDDQRRMAAIRNREHGRCFVCNPDNHRGLGLDFRARRDGTVVASFACGRVFEGYPDWLHGGVISSVMDGAMTNCLFARGIVAVTAELSVRFTHPVVIDRQASVRAWVEKSYPPLYVMRAELFQGGDVLATASGKFMQRPADGCSLPAEEVEGPPTSE
jgi:acyl-coenzyme A thioesterase PaaI-like protein